MIGPAEGQPLRVGFLPLGSDDWLAATTHLVNWLQALRAANVPDIKPVLLGPGPALLEAIAAALGEAPEAVRDVRIPAERAQALVDHVVRRWLRVDLQGARRYASADVSVVVGNAVTYKPRRRALLSWIPDFQHLHIPEFFLPEDRKHRNWVYRRTALVSDRVLVTSASVARDFARFAPRQASKCVVLRPAAQPLPIAASDSPGEVALRHRLPERFFYLPNHFWVHKNHKLVIEAVAILVSQGLRVVVAATGQPADYRSPGYSERLFAEVQARGLSDCFCYLGLVPHEEVSALMRRAIAVLNPSRFEGWAYGVDEAVALGRPLLLSDIPTHHEHESEDVVFFPPDDPAVLAARLAEAWALLPSGPDRDREARASRAASRRLAKLGEKLSGVIREVAALPSS